MTKLHLSCPLQATMLISFQSLNLGIHPDDLQGSISAPIEESVKGYRQQALNCHSPKGIGLHSRPWKLTF